MNRIRHSGCFVGSVCVGAKLAIGNCCQLVHTWTGVSPPSTNQAHHCLTFSDPKRTDISKFEKLHTLNDLTQSDSNISEYTKHQLQTSESSIDLYSGEIAGCNSCLCFFVQLIPSCPSGQNNASTVDKNGKMTEVRHCWTSGRLQTPEQCRTPGWHLKTLKKIFLVSFFYCFAHYWELAKKLICLFLKPYDNLNWTDLKIMQINLLVHVGRIASATLDLFSSSRAGSTNFATHLPYYRDKWPEHVLTKF